NDLFVMIANGLWPAEDSKASSTSHGNPRVGDGLVHIDAHGLVTYASPNATSAFRKLGIRESMEGGQLSRMVTNHLDQGTPVNESMPAVLFGRQSARVDIETRKIVLSARSIPLINQDGELFAALVLLRDITEIRRRDEQLISKDATIREIHHRVKNNLQTVGSLLRMQSRRMQSDDARQALLQAMSRVDAIAMVHETLSQTMDATVDMDELLHRQFTMAVDIAAGSKAVTTVIRGSFGELPGHLATPLALVVNELATNAVEHGTAAHGGEITLLVKRLQGTDNRDSQLKVEVVDEGKSGSADATYSIGNGLGTQIIRTLVESDLRGTICSQRQHPATTGTAGTRAIVHVPWELSIVLARAHCAQHQKLLTASCSAARRARAWRRFSARRSSSLLPPQTPESWPVSSAHCKHTSCTGQVRQIAFASSICNSAGPVLPTGKKSSGSLSRQAARLRQSMFIAP